MFPLWSFLSLSKPHSYNLHSSSLNTLTMHYSTFLIAATALCATSASACFNTGEHWGDHNNAKGSLKQACYSITGHYDGYQIKQNCQNAPTPNLNYVFSINNKNAGGRYLSQADCENNIGEIIDTCGHGGERTVNGVIYRYTCTTNCNAEGYDC